MNVEQIIGSAIVAASVVGLCIAAIVRWHANESRDAIAFATREVQTLARVVVVPLAENVVAPVKAANRWNAEAAKVVKQEATDEILRLLSKKSKAVLRRSTPDLGEFLSAAIEEQAALDHKKGFDWRLACDALDKAVRDNDVRVKSTDIILLEGNRNPKQLSFGAQEVLRESGLLA